MSTDHSLKATRGERFTNRTFPALLTTTGLLLGAWTPTAALGQPEWNITNATVLIKGEGFADDWIPTPPLVGETVTCFENAYIAGGLGSDYGIGCNQLARESSGVPSFALAQILAQAKINGDQTTEVVLDWYNLARVQVGAPDGYSANAASNLNTTVDFTITSGPANQAVIVYFYWEAYGSGLTNHENVMEDPVVSLNSLTLYGVEQTVGRFNFADPAVPGAGPAGFNHVKSSGTMWAAVGDTISVTVTSDLSAAVNRLPESLVTHSDHADALFRGRLRMTVGFPPTTPPPFPPPPPTGLPSLANTSIEFSLDIGSDSEMSAAPFNLGEVFDPGDAYAWQQPPLPPGGLDGVKNDELIFGSVDFSPFAPDGPPPVSGAPTCSLLPPPAVSFNWFDLDGHDNLDVSLQTLPIGPMHGPLPLFPAQCIFSAEFLAISFDDDGPGHYAGDPIVPTCDIPIFSQSPALQATYGTTTGRDEVVGLIVTPATIAVPGAVTLHYPIADEAFIHPSLAPNPDASELDDDDVDSLDIPWDPAGCAFWYFTADHEATAFDFLTGISFDPGDIYEVDPAGLQSPVAVVDDVIHLGLPDETDLKDFEFVWIFEPNLAGDALAVIFTVGTDDPLTPENESGGLDPAMIYASFMTGYSFPLLNAPVPDAVDALTAWYTDLIPAPSFGACCLPVVGCTITGALSCLGYGGDYRGDGTDCSDVNQNGEADACECLTCRGDLNGDGNVDGMDIQNFVDCLLGGPGAGNCGCADIDADGSLNMGDLGLFATALITSPYPSCP